MTEPIASDILKRFAQATASVGVLGKDRTNKHDNYSYLSEEAVKQAAQKAIADFELAPNDIELEIISNDWRVAKSGGEMNYVNVRCILRWTGVGKCEGLGSGRDYGDKALLKAQTAAVREAWKNRFTIPTGMDPEKDDRAPARQDPPRRPPPRPAQQQQRAESPRPIANAQRRSDPPPPQQAPSNGNGGYDKLPAVASALETKLSDSLIAELQEREHPDDLKQWADGLMKLPPKQRTPLWTAFAERCKSLNLDPGRTARVGLDKKAGA